MNDADRSVCMDFEQLATESVWMARDAGAISDAQQTDILRLITDASLRPEEVGPCFDSLFSDGADSPWLDLLRAQVGLTAQVRASAEMGWVRPLAEGSRGPARHRTFQTIGGR